MREQIEALEHHADAPALAGGDRRRVRHNLPSRISPAMLTPSSRTSPSDGISIRFTHRSRVDFPAPLGPITMTISPCVDLQIDPVHDRDIAEDFR